MTLPELRPALADLALHLFDRMPHPELLPAKQASERLHGPSGTSVELALTSAGHLLHWTGPTGEFLEAVGPRDLPSALLRRVSSGPQLDRDVAGRHYRSCVAVETLPPERFALVHDEIVHGALRRGLIFRFGPAQRVRLAPLGWVAAEFLPSGLSVIACHTFPDEYAVLKVQTLIE